MKILLVLLIATTACNTTFEPLAVTRISDLEVTNQIQMVSTSGPKVLAGTGDPNGAVSAPQGSLRMQTDTATLWQNTDGSTAWVAVTAGAAVSTIGIFGDGSDGTQTFDGTSTVLGLVPSSNVYTLTRDIQCDSCTIDAGVQLKGGWRVFDIGTLTLNGTIQRNGNNASGRTAGALLDADMFNSAPAGGTGGTSAGGAPSAGNSTSLAGTGCTAGQAAAGANGGPCQGGGGGGGFSGAGALGGNVNLKSPYHGDLRMIWQWPAGRRADAQNGYLGVASGGGGGRGDSSAVQEGGGGGGAAGYLFTAAFNIVGTGSITANGGNGGDGQAGGDTGGGGGGGGGWVNVLTTGTCPTMSAVGGTGGAAGGAGVAGGDGGDGFTYCLVL